MKNSEKIYFPNLDALRSVACLFVLVSHTFWEALIQHFSESSLVNNPVLFFFLGNGGFGVRIFFVLSGFLITFLIIKEIQKTGKVSLRDFYIRRVLRIWPVYFAVVAFVFALYAVGKNFHGHNSMLYERFPMSLLFLSNYDLIHILHTPTAYPNGMLALTWSVSVEEQFYLVWPVLLFLVPLRYFYYVIAGIIMVSIVFSFMNAGDRDVIYNHTLSNFIFLGSGGVLAYLTLCRPRFMNFCSTVRKSTWTILLLSGLLFTIFLREPLFAMHGGIVVYFIGTALALFIFVLTQTASVKSPVQLGASKFLVSMGKYTYGLYMYHRIAIFFLAILFGKVFGEHKSLFVELIFIVFYFLGAFLLSFISYRFMERPLLQIKNRFSLFRKN